MTGGETVVFVEVPPPPTARPVDQLFAALGDPVRRSLLLVLSDGKLRTVSQLKGSAGRKLDATLKHPVALRAAGLVVTRENPEDGRRQLYTLAPGVVARATASGGQEIDFGPRVVRLGVTRPLIDQFKPSSHSPRQSCAAAVRAGAFCMLSLRSCGTLMPAVPAISQAWPTNQRSKPAAVTSG